FVREVGAGKDGRRNAEGRQDVQSTTNIAERIVEGDVEQLPGARESLLQCRWDVAGSKGRLNLGLEGIRTDGERILPLGADRVIAQDSRPASTRRRGHHVTVELS